MKYLCIKNDWSEAQFHSIEWNCLNQVIIKKLNMTRRISLLKMQTNWDNTSHQKDNFLQFNVKCPMCKNTPETTFHLLTFPSRNITKKWDTINKALKK